MLESTLLTSVLRNDVILGIALESSLITEVTLLLSLVLLRLVVDCIFDTIVLL